jgi:GNAT superfamily N-acetyltransferase
MLNYTRYTGDSLAEGCRLILEHECYAIHAILKVLQIKQTSDIFNICCDYSLMCSYSLIFLGERKPSDSFSILCHDENYENELQEIIIVTTDDNTYVAAGMLSTVMDKNSNTPSYLQVFTKPSYRKQGIATQIISVFAQYNDISNHHFKGEKICLKSESVNH